MEGVAVNAPSDTSYRQVTGPLRSTVRDGLCLLCTNRLVGLMGGQRQDAQLHSTGLETHIDGCLRTAINKRKPTIFIATPRNGESSLASSSSEPDSDVAPDAPRVSFADGVWVCPDPVCSANDRQF